MKGALTTMRSRCSTNLAKRHIIWSRNFGAGALVASSFTFANGNEATEKRPPLTNPRTCLGLRVYI
jgi:hypothetical protein